MSKHKHDHDHCHHVMKHCEHCDVAYCEKCGREWGKTVTWYPYWGYTYTNPLEYKVWCGDSATTSATSGISVTSGSIHAYSTDTKPSVMYHNHGGNK